jgi:acyl-CoA reductase-like NAD-dependent aldehyde dehydrogenase
MSLEGLSILGHSRVKPAGKPVAAINPANGSELPTSFHWATSEDVSRAAELASKAFAEYRRWPASRRARFLRLIATLIETNDTALV